MQVKIFTAAAASTAALAAAGVAGTDAALSADANPRVAAGGPRVDVMVVLRGNRTIRRRVRAGRARVTVDGRRCTVGAATPMSGLLALDPSGLALRDYGGCTRRPADGAGLFVRAIRGQRNRRMNGWVYKTGPRLGTAGGADPSGPFGNGRMRPGTRLVWFYCVFDEGSCQRTLVARRRLEGRELSVTVTGYDDAGDGVPIAGARVVAVGRPPLARVAERTGADGRATLSLARGRYVLHALRHGAIRAFPTRVVVR